MKRENAQNRPGGMRNFNLSAFPEDTEAFILVFAAYFPQKSFQIPNIRLITGNKIWYDPFSTKGNCITRTGLQRMEYEL
jgi:hypothetical protein